MSTFTGRLCLLTLLAVIVAGCGGKAKVSPTLSGVITITPGSIMPGTGATADIVFSEPVTGFTATDVRVSGGARGAMTDLGGNHFSVALTAGTAGTTAMTVTIPARSCADSRRRVLGMEITAQTTVAHAAWGAITLDGAGTYADLTLTSPYGTAVQRFRLIPAGSFTMGSAGGEAGREPQDSGSETVHTVTLSTAYWLADSECTQRFWHATTNANPSFFTAGGLDLPVEQVSHDDATAFLATLNALAPGLDARLPSEAEWEYAARAGTITPFSIAPVDSGNIVCWVDAGDPYVASGANLGMSATVKGRTANPWGLYDVHGNVWEWCSDWYQTDLGSVPVTDPPGPASGTTRVLRGGSWGDYGRFSRSANRRQAAPTTVSGGFGFRIAVPDVPVGSG
jgi:formylglycine-generating enzyme required for sulfatase activity